MELEWIAACKDIQPGEQPGAPNLIGIHADGVLIASAAVLPIEAHIPVAVSIVAPHSELENGALVDINYRVLDSSGNTVGEDRLLHLVGSPSGIEADLPRRGVLTIVVVFDISGPGRFEIQVSLDAQVRSVPFVVEVG